MDFPTRARIVLGMLAIVLALLASMALLNLLVLEPGTSGTEQGGGPTGTFNPQPTGQPSPTEAPEGEDQNGTAEPTPSGGKKNPCKTGKSVTRAASITTTAMALMLWLLAVWWRQQRQTRVMNGWAIAALVFTLLAVTLFFAWYIINQICELRVTDLDSCRQIARNLLVTFVAFVVPALGFLGYAIKRKREGHRFMGLWAGAGFVFVYLSVMALGGYIVADDICDRYFRPDLDDIDLDGPDGDGGPQNTQTGTDSGTQTGSPPTGTSGPPPGGSNPGNGGGNRGNTGGGNAPSLVGVPQISPVALLIIMGIAAIIVIVVLAVRGGGKGFGGGMGGVDEALIVEDRGRLLAMLKRADLTSNDKVVAAYRAFLAHCAVRGLGKSDAETPLEHARRAIVGLSLPEPDTLSLAHAYSQTRLGNTPPPRTLREKALAFMRSLEGR